MKQLKTNDAIRDAVKAYNNEFAHRLNGVLLSFTGSRIKGYSLYFKDAVSGRIISTIMTGNEKAILTSIGSIYQFSASPVLIIKPVVS